MSSRDRSDPTLMLVIAAGAAAVVAWRAVSQLTREEILSVLQASAPLFLVVVAIVIMVGAVPSQEALRLAVAVVVGGVFLVTLATLLMRLAVWFARRGRAG